MTQQPCCGGGSPVRARDKLGRVSRVHALGRGGYGGELGRRRGGRGGGVVPRPGGRLTVRRRIFDTSPGSPVGLLRPCSAARPPRRRRLSADHDRRFLIATGAAAAAVILGPVTRVWWGAAVAEDSPPVDPCAGKCDYTAKVDYKAVAAAGGL